MSIINRHHALEGLIKGLDKPVGDFQFLLSQIDEDVENLQELRGEVYERIDNLMRSIDLNHKIEADKENHGK